MPNKLDLEAFEFKQVGQKEWELPSGVFSVTVMHSKIPGRKIFEGVGVDPGRNFGIATLDGREAWVLFGTLPKELANEKWRYGVAAFEMMKRREWYYGKGIAVVEGAAFKEPFGQADLAHIRMGFVLGLYCAGFNVGIKAPATIRANALGSGKLGGLEVWPELNHNGSDALATALYAAGLKKGEQKRGTDIRT